MNKALFLDRDGVINVNYPPYVHEIKDLKFCDGSLEALVKLSKLDYLLIIVTNQSGVGRGHYSLDVAMKFNAELVNQINKAGGRIDATYMCAHAPAAGCQCRKPSPGMIYKASAEHGIYLPESFLIGDKDTDIQAGMLAHCSTVGIGNGRCMHSDYTFDSLLDFANDFCMNRKVYKSPVLTK